jgi:hypothetical protein
MGPICCPRNSIKDYHTRLRNTPEERRFRFSSHGGENVTALRTFFGGGGGNKKGNHHLTDLGVYGSVILGLNPKINVGIC